KSAGTAPRLFDIGCGDGTWMAAARDMNIDVHGIDISDSFVDMCREKGLEVELESAVLATPPAGTNAVTALGEVLAYAPAAFTPCALILSRTLPKGAVFIFDLPGPDTPETETSVQGERWSLTSKTQVDGKRLTRTIQVDTKDGLSEEVHQQTLFAADEVADILREFGFDVDIVKSYGPCRLLPGRFGILARKK
ncbi:MAG TPA: class I SAM-dependent methyltransferase, partial [Aliiroseovarius sp.]|nr:class I SAM-dependent methyltransferase [Aliiroseovarius sp.]